MSVALPASEEAKIMVDGEVIDPSELGLTDETLRELANRMASISVRAVK